MPTYVYECSSCNNTFEVEQRITEDPLRDCRCGASGTVKRLIQPTAVMFKGSGFHINDYKGPSAPSEKAEVNTEKGSDCTGEPGSCPSCSAASEAKVTSAPA